MLTNYPNPFNGSTVIEFSGFTGENNSVEIFDIAGRLVRKIPLGNSNSVIWEGRDRSGDDVSAGIYFARVTGKNTIVRKMLYLK
jgi:flagellar hook assembly protein FlgD